MDDIELERNHSFQQNTIDNFDLNVSSSRLFPNNFNSTIEELIEKSLSISHVNIRSLYKNFDSLQELYEENFKNKFKLIGLSEIWNVKDIDHFRIPGYNLEIQCRAKQRGGGVGAYIHSSLNYSRINNISLINAESIWLKLNLMNQTIIMGVVYRKPGTNFEEFKQEFEFVLQNLNLDKKLTIIMGDFNVDLTSDEEKSRELIRLTESYGLVQLIKTATRVTNTSSTLIDHIYTNISSYCIKSGCIEAGISDHLPTYALLENFDFKPAKKVVRRLRNFRNYSKDSFCDDLSTAQWKEIYKCTDPDEAYELFYTIFLEVCNKHAPVQEVSFNSKKRNNPWITKSIKKSIRKNMFYIQKPLSLGMIKRT